MCVLMCFHKVDIAVWSPSWLLGKKKHLRLMQITRRQHKSQGTCGGILCNSYYEMKWHWDQYLTISHRGVMTRKETGGQGSVLPSAAGPINLSDPRMHGHNIIKVHITFHSRHAMQKKNTTALTCNLGNRRFYLVWGQGSYHFISLYIIIYKIIIYISFL